MAPAAAPAAPASLPGRHAGADAEAADTYQEALAAVVVVEVDEGRLGSAVERCPDFLDARLLWALLALAGGRAGDAAARLAPLEARRTTLPRRDRQLLEIVQGAVAGRRFSSHGLAAEHLAEHPGDQTLLTAMAVAMARQAGDGPATV